MTLSVLVPILRTVPAGGARRSMTQKPTCPRNRKLPPPWNPDRRRLLILNHVADELLEAACAAPARSGLDSPFSHPSSPGSSVALSSAPCRSASFTASIRTAPPERGGFFSKCFQKPACQGSNNDNPIAGQFAIRQQMFAALTDPLGSRKINRLTDNVRPPA